MLAKSTSADSKDISSEAGDRVSMTIAYSMKQKNELRVFLGNSHVGIDTLLPYMWEREPKQN